MKRKKKFLFIAVLVLSVFAFIGMYNMTTVGIYSEPLKDLDNGDMTKWYVMFIIALISSVLGWAAYKFVASYMDN